MDVPETQTWYLRKHDDGIIFGPISFDQLLQWASEAQIAPHDAISTDQGTWMKAPMLPQLKMDWLVEVTSERYYGPTTLGAIQEFIHLGEIDGETYIINACDGSRRQIQEFDGFQFLEMAPVEISPEQPPSDQPLASRISIDLQDRIRDLEQALLEERHAFEESEERYHDLEQRYRQLEAGLSSLGKGRK